MSSAGSAKAVAPLDFLFALALASLFSGIFYDSPFVRLRPFEILGTLCVLGTLFRYGAQTFNIPGALWAGAAFLFVHAVSAYTVSSLNGLRETFQVTEILTFTVAFLAHYRNGRVGPMLKALSIMVVLIMIYSAIWHIQAGFYFGWKRLGDPKSGFLLIPVMASALLAGGNRNSFRSYAILFAAALFIFLSGERKAYLAMMFALVLTFGLTDIRLLLAMATLVLVAAIAAITDPQGYLAHQVYSLVAPELEENWVTLTYSDIPQSLSNAQRAFASQLVWSLFQESPLFGVGTNAYITIVGERFWYLPSYLRLGVHNEFSRVFVENGLAGFSLYLSAWLFAFWRLTRNTNFTGWWRGMRGADRTRTIFFACCLCYCFFEASKSLSMLAFLFANFAHVIVPAGNRGASSHKFKAAQPAFDGRGGLKGAADQLASS